MSPALQAVVGLAFTGWGAFGIAILVANEWRRRYYVERARADDMQQRASRWMTRAVRAEGDHEHFAYDAQSGTVWDAPPGYAFVKRRDPLRPAPLVVDTSSAPPRAGVDA